MFNRSTIFKDARKERQLFTRRIWLIAAFIVLLISLLIARLIYLQLVQQKLYTTLAKQNQLNLLPAEPNRGLIYDRHGVLLADNIPVYNLVFRPEHHKNYQDLLTALRSIITITPDDLAQFNKAMLLHRRFEAVPVRTRLSEEEVARFSVNQYRFPGFSIQAQMIRHYPFGAAFAAVLGYVGRINAKELAQVEPSNYSATNFIGKTGIEKFYETPLHGQVGYQQVESDATGKVVRTQASLSPIPGENLYLALDSRLQLKAQAILGDQRAALVALNPNNGEVLALLSMPSFDPNLFVAGISQKNYAALTTAAGQPLFNRALRGHYSPGSTVKPFISLAGLQDGAVSTDTYIYDPGWFKLANNAHIYYGFRRLAHGSVNLVRAIAVSSDIYFYNLAIKLGITRIAALLTQFGFGAKTNIDLSDELGGILPTPAWKAKMTHQAWYPGDTLNTGIGQGFMEVTPIQLATGVAALGAQGHRWRPRVLLATQTSAGVHAVNAATALATVQLPSNLWATVTAGMQQVVTLPEGTANPFFKNITYTVAGKTGTAQVYSLRGQRYNKAMVPVQLRDNSLFICFAPAAHPQIALAIVVQNYTTPAAQVARELLDYYFAEIAVAPQTAPASPTATLKATAAQQD